MSDEHPKVVELPARWAGLPVVLVLGGKVLAGVLAALAIVQAWGVWARVDDRLKGADPQTMTVTGIQAADVTEVAGWGDTRDYAVFYPLLPGDDVDNMANLFANGPDKIWPAVTRDLYPVLDEAGAVFIDATQYESGVPPSPAMPRAPITVNLNYLARYPILGEDGQAITLDPAEEAWIVAVPATLRSQQAQIEDYFDQWRGRKPGFQSASEFYESMFDEPAPQRFLSQEVRIIWTAPNQALFSFDSEVNPTGGYTITDPIVQVITPANSLPVDRLNAISGSPNAALKVFAGGDPAGTYQRLLSTLQRLNLDDNLPALVFANEAPLTRLDFAEAASRISRATAISVAVIMLALGVASSAMIVSRLRRVLIVRRLHGFGFLRRNQELLIVGVLSTLGMLSIGGLMLVGDRFAGFAPASYRGIASGHLAGVPLRLAAIIVALSAIELVMALGLAAIIQRRTGALLVKQL